MRGSSTGLHSKHSLRQDILQCDCRRNYPCDWNAVHWELLMEKGTVSENWQIRLKQSSRTFFCKDRTKLWLHGTTLPNLEQFLSLLYLLYTSNLFPDPLNKGKMRHDEAGRSWQATGHSLITKKSIRGKIKKAVVISETTSNTDRTLKQLLSKWLSWI